MHIHNTIYVAIKEFGWKLFWHQKMKPKPRFDIITIAFILSILRSIVNGTEFFIGSIDGDYNEAIDICLNENGTLATIINENDYNIVRELCNNSNTDCWIGLNNRINKDIWTYIDGTSVKGTYGFDINGKPTKGITPWNSGEPNNAHKPSEYCVKLDYIRYENFKWNDARCYLDKKPICMRTDVKITKQL